MNKIIPIDENYSLPQNFKSTLENLKSFIKDNFGFNSTYYLDSHTYRENDYSGVNKDYFQTYLLIIFNLKKDSNIDNLKEKLLLYFLSDIGFSEYFGKDGEKLNYNFWGNYIEDLTGKNELTIYLDITYSSGNTELDGNIINFTDNIAFTQNYDKDTEYITYVMLEYQKMLNGYKKETFLTKCELDEDEILEGNENLEFIKKGKDYFEWTGNFSCEEVYNFCKNICSKYDLIVDYYDQFQINFKNKSDLSLDEIKEIALELMNFNKKDFGGFLGFFEELKKGELTIYLVD